MLRLAFLCAAFATVLGVCQHRPEELFEWGPYDSAVKRPQDILPYAPGAKHTTYMEQQKVIETILAAAPTRTRYFELGSSWEGRPLRAVAISTPENIKRLDALRQIWGQASQGKPVPPDTPALVWINENIHGDEAASFESAMYLIYNLASSKNGDLLRAMKDAVVIVNPCYNPDGHERYVVWQRSIAVGSPDPAAPEHRSPAWVSGRYNHYRFDMNRDRVAMSQKETRAEVSAILNWNPHVYVDQHGEVETYFFPPTSMSLNNNVDRDRYKKWTEVFGRACGVAFDRRGWGYYVRDVFDFYGPIYLDTFATLTGAIGMTFETDMAEIRRTNGDGSERTLLGGMAKHLVAAIATIRSAAANKDELLKSYVQYKASAMEGSGLMGRRYFAAQFATKRQAERMANQLSSMGVQSDTTLGVLQAEKPSSLWKDEAGLPKEPAYWVTVDLWQKQGHFAKTVLETESDFEAEFTTEQLRRAKEEPRSGYEFYDLTGWSLPLLHNAPAWWLGGKPDVKQAAEETPGLGASNVGYALVAGEEGTELAMRLMEKGVRLKLSPNAMTLGGKQFPAWTILALRRNNSAESLAELAKNAQARPIPTGFPDSDRYGPGSEGIEDLRGFKVGVLFGEEPRTTGFSSIWYELETRGIAFTPLRTEGLSGKLDRFSCLIIPSGGSATPTEKVKEFVSGGGCVVVLGGRYGMTDWLNLTTQTVVKEPKPVPGSIFRAKLDMDHWLCSGMSKDSIAAPVDGSQFYAKGANTVAWFDGGKGAALTGWVWPEDTEKAVADTSFCEVASVGRGHVVWFAQDPTDRAMWPGLWPLVLNAMVLGPRQ